MNNLACVLIKALIHPRMLSTKITYPKIEPLEFLRKATRPCNSTPATLMARSHLATLRGWQRSGLPSLLLQNNSTNV